MCWRAVHAQRVLCVTNTWRKADQRGKELGQWEKPQMRCRVSLIYPEPYTQLPGTLQCPATVRFVWPKPVYLLPQLHAEGCCGPTKGLYQYHPTSKTCHPSGAGLALHLPGPLKLPVLSHSSSIMSSVIQATWWFPQCQLLTFRFIPVTHNLL